jgi:hypothetical protein
MCSSDFTKKLHPAHEAHIFGVTKICAFHEDDEFRSFADRLQQIARGLKFFDEYYHATPPNGSIIRVLNLHTTGVTRALKHGYAVPYIHTKAGQLLTPSEGVIIHRFRFSSQNTRRINPKLYD